MTEKTPFKTEKRNVHLLIDQTAYTLAKIECAKIDVDLSHATEQLYRLWEQGIVTVNEEL